MLDKLDPHPIGLEAPATRPALLVDAADEKLLVGELDRLMGARRAVVGAEGPIDKRDIETAEAEDRPGALQKKDHAGGEIHRHHRAHQDEKALRAQGAVGRQDRVEVKRPLEFPVRVGLHGVKIG